MPKAPLDPGFLYASAFEKAAIGMAIVNFDGTTITANPALLALFGYSAEEFRAKTVQDLSHSDDLERDGALLQAMLAGQHESYEMEKRYYRKNGQLFWGHLTVSLVRDPQGEPAYVVATVADISERKRTEATLQELNESLENKVAARAQEIQENEALYRNVFEYAAIGMARVYPNEEAGTISHTNKALQRFLGYSDEEMERLTVKDLSQDDDFHADQQRLLAMINKQYDYYQLEKRYYRKNGEMVWAILTVSLVRDAQGNPAFTVSTIQDITARKEAEEAVQRYNDQLEQMVRERTSQLQENEERFRQLAENIREVFWLTTPENDVMLYISPAYEDVWGQSCQSLYENPGFWLDSVYPADHAWVVSQVKGIAKRNLDMEYRILRSDGTLRWIRAQTFRVRDAAGQVYRIAGLAEDITVRKEEEEIRKELSRRILNAQESERQRVARDLHDSVNQVLVSAKFRLEMLEINPVPAELLESKQLLKGAIQEIRQISNNLRPSELDLLGFLPTIRGLCDTFSMRTGIPHTLQLAPGFSPAFQPDVELMLYRILQEGFNNIEKHARATQVFLHCIKVKSWIKIILGDNGAGFEPEQVKVRKDTQSGWGLINIRERILLAGGSLHIQSAPGQGTLLELRVGLDKGR